MFLLPDRIVGDLGRKVLLRPRAQVGLVDDVESALAGRLAETSSARAADYHVTGTWWNPYTDGITGKQIAFTGDNVDEMYSYNQPGQVTGKRLRVTRTTNDGNVTAPDLNAAWTYDNEGRMSTVSYPGDPNAYLYPAATYSYSYDGMGRLGGMSETAPSSATVVSSVTYNAAGQMKQMTEPYVRTESRSYNSMGQLTNITVAGSLNITYNYSSSQNNGKIAWQADNISGEQVSYAYDSLNRLVCAYGGNQGTQLSNCTSVPSGSTWGQGFSYDPFGNLTDKNVLYGSVTTLHVVIDPTTNHAGGEDANGNAGTTGTYPTYVYDVENRLAAALTIVQGSTEQYYNTYAYDAQNKRVWKNTPTYSQTTGMADSELYYFYGPNGKLLVQFTPLFTPRAVGVQASLAWQNGPSRTYLGSRLLGNEDRLGSRGTYFPYGEDRSSQNPPNDAVKFATYTRDAATGLDYADQRYYSSVGGRFMTPDPYQASGGPADPQTWNRYAYAGNDPVNFYDPSGLIQACPAGTHNNGTNQCILNPAPDIITWTPAQSFLRALQVAWHSEYLADLYGNGYERPTAANIARDVRNEVADHSITDCEALAEFADTLSQTTHDSASFVRSFGVLTPTVVGTAVLPGMVSTSTPIILQAPNTQSGFASNYQDLDMNADQSHHFAAFLQVGFLYGAAVGGASAELLENIEGSSYNTGDITLGTIASGLGSKLASGALKPGELGDYIRNNICAH